MLGKVEASKEYALSPLLLFSRSDDYFCPSESLGQNVCVCLPAIAMALATVGACPAFLSALASGDGGSLQAAADESVAK